MTKNDTTTHKLTLNGSGTIVLAATPIGNPKDVSLRFLELLETADIIAAEDTRKIRHLANILQTKICGKTVSYHAHNENERIPQLINHAKQGKTILITSDAGMPTISDPGYKLVKTAHTENILITALPGPSATLTALALSGLPSDKFCFEGFLPRKQTQRTERLTQLQFEPRTIIFFEAPHRIVDMLTDATKIFTPQRQAAICKELTKKYEQTHRNTLENLLKTATENPLRGELVVVIAGNNNTLTQDIQQCVTEVFKLTQLGVRLKDAVTHVATAKNVQKRELYDLVIAQKNFTKQ